ncbi:spore coat protein X [Virgibacillus natechei]|uniref:Spore coat protein X n=1 Tax=Virgibacillus natechei TaxID=1216297 RepID=A0ABS4IBZ4_9BACI|nr:spore coat protein [Virgibacillus natechei]MBP1968459.1 spore coat protein X [Virgibacillus natechei]UZD13580.1 spore coat protein [Virgibacillus natechei]
MSNTTKWRALDHCDDVRNVQSDAAAIQDGGQSVSEQQISNEWIIIKDSEGVDVTSTDTQAAVSLQVGIQAAIEAIINISIGSGDESEGVTQDLRQIARTRQVNHQKTIIEQSQNVEISTVNTDVIVNIQLLIQVLVAIVVSLDIL